MRQHPALLRLCNMLVILGVLLSIVALFFPSIFVYVQISNNGSAAIRDYGYEIPKAVYNAASLPNLLLSLLPLLPFILLLTLTLVSIGDVRRFQRFQSLQWVSFAFMGFLLLCNASAFVNVLLHGQPVIGPGLVLLGAGLLLAFAGLLGLSFLPWPPARGSTEVPKK